jgi:hypothetical protein
MVVNTHKHKASDQGFLTRMKKAKELFEEQGKTALEAALGARVISFEGSVDGHAKALDRQAAIDALVSKQDEHGSSLYFVGIRIIDVTDETRAPITLRNTVRMGNTDRYETEIEKLRRSLARLANNDIVAAPRYLCFFERAAGDSLQRLRIVDTRKLMDALCDGPEPILFKLRFEFQQTNGTKSGRPPIGIARASSTGATFLFIHREWERLPEALVYDRAISHSSHVKHRTAQASPGRSPLRLFDRKAEGKGHQDARKPESVVPTDIVQTTAQPKGFRFTRRRLCHS